jgi:hypothetical protein
MRTDAERWLSLLRSEMALLLEAFDRMVEDEAIDRSQWNSLVEDSLRALEHRTLFLVNDAHFTPERGNRWTVKSTALNYFTIFPWFRNGRSRARYREALKGHTLAHVLEAVNYFLNRHLLPNEIQFLRHLYLEMEIPVKNPLTKIIELKSSFEHHLLVAELNGQYFSLSLSLPVSVSPSLLTSPSRLWLYLSIRSATQTQRRRRETPVDAGGRQRNYPK